MKIDNWSEEYQELLRFEAKKLESWGVEELAMRIAVAVLVQDSCRDCQSETIKMILVSGIDGLYLCKKCQKETEDFCE